MPETLLWAWRKVRRCYRSADSLYDQAALAAFELNLEAELEGIRADFAAGHWVARPIRLVPQTKKPDKEGKPRLRQYFEIAVRDQVAWTAMATVLGPELDRKMPAWSYGNRLYRAAWYEEESPEGKGSQLNIGPYRHSAGHLYRHFKHSWPLYRRHISLTARRMVSELIDEDELDQGERRALDQTEGLAYLELPFWIRPPSQGEKLYAASFDLMKFYPTIRLEAIVRGFEEYIDGFRDEAPLATLLNDMLRFEVDDSGLTDEMKTTVEPQVPPGLFEGIPTGLFAGGFLANVAMLPLDLKVDEILRERRTIAHFRFVDDHEVLAYDFKALVAWIEEYARLLEAFNIGARIEPDKYVPSELKSILHPELCEGSGEASETHDELIEKVARAAEVNGRKPTELMTRTLAQVSMLAATDFDLLTDAGRGQRLEQLEWLLLANIPEQEIRGDTRMAFAAARIATLTPALFRPNDELLEAHRHLALTLEKKRKIETAGKSLDESAEAEIQRLYEKIELRKRDEQSIWEALLKRHFGLLFEAFHAHPDKARLFIRMIDYCRATGHDGFSRLGEWMRLHGEGETRLLKCYLGALGVQHLARHLLTACAAVNRVDLLHREREAARSFINHTLRADIDAFVPLSRAEPLQRFQLDAKSAFVASMLLGALEVGRTDPALATSMRQRAAETLEAVPTLANLRTATQVSVGIWSHWFFATTGTHRYDPPAFWPDMVTEHDTADSYDWINLRRYPAELPNEAWTRLRLEPTLLAADDAGWLLDAARAAPDQFAVLSADSSVVAAVASRIALAPDTMSLRDWVAYARTRSPSDPRRSEWTALEITRQILEPLFKFGGPDADFLDRLHPENVRIPMTWRNVEPDRRINDRITWEGWCRLAREESATMIKPGIDDFRYSELVQRTERRWERRLRPFGQLLWGILRLSFALPAAWNIRGQERSLVDTVTWDLERLPISSFTLAILQSCLMPRSVETSFLPLFPSLFGNLLRRAADDSEFDRPIRSPDALRYLLVKAQGELERSQMTVLEHEPRQLIPVRLQQIGAFADGDAAEGDQPQ
ncbi:RNA-directed DNA polymerase [Sphingobium sp. H39-3-25]|uniref:RNA-directed DNA polymerase n=1 Tax=Sphingobium arseniciresistens TaxID=3030834 RepID=UPI0023B8950C|nr:RNA-directed DNA polymerase [Sphingobium arseniciresistens]